MQFLKLPFLLGAFAATTLAAHAQAGKQTSYTTVDAFGNLTRTTVETPPPINTSAAAQVADQIAERMRAQKIYGESLISRSTVTPPASNATVLNSATTTRIYTGRGDGRGAGRGRDYQNYYVPGYPALPSYPYPAPNYNNNYYYPALPTTTEIGPRPYSWAFPTTITNIPLGTYSNGYPTSGYPGYPAPNYPVCPPPAYGYPAPVYGYPTTTYSYPAPGYGYPAYGGTYYNGYGNGSVYSQSNNSGFGLSIGNGGISVRLGNNRSNTTTTVRHY